MERVLGRWATFWNLCNDTRVYGISIAMALFWPYSITCLCLIVFVNTCSAVTFPKGPLALPRIALTQLQYHILGTNYGRRTFLEALMVKLGTDG